jgi:anti-anti-sigma regulatory factor
MSQTETKQLGLRKIGNVQVFDLTGALTGEGLDPVIQKIEQTIQRKKLRRVILNLQKVSSMDEIALRRIAAVLLRPQRSLIFAPDGACRKLFDSTHLPNNIKLCKNEEEVADSFGSFLFVKDKAYEVPIDESQPKPPEYGIDRRRSKRIRVAIPIKIQCKMKDKAELELKAIATNVSQGGLFAEFLDLDTPGYDQMQGLEGNQVTVLISPNETFKESMSVPGKINRFELLKKQYGIAIQFI